MLVSGRVCLGMLKEKRWFINQTIKKWWLDFEGIYIYIHIYNTYPRGPRTVLMVALWWTYTAVKIQQMFKTIYKAEWKLWDISELLVLKMLETTHHPSDHPSSDFPGTSIKILSRPKPALVKYPKISVQYTKHVLCKTCLFQFTF